MNDTRYHGWYGLHSLFIVVSALACMFGLASCSGTLGSPRSTQQVTAIGFGETVEQARRDAFRNAIQSAYSTLLVSQRLVVDDVLKEEDFSYSAGVVIDHKVLSGPEIDRASGLLKITALVTVSDTKLRHRVELLAESKGSKFSGAQIIGKIGEAQRNATIQDESFRIRQRQATDLLASVGKQFPVMDITIEKVKALGRNGGHSHEISVDISLKINREYLGNFCKAAKTFRDSSKDLGVSGPTTLLSIRTLNWGVCFPEKVHVPINLGSHMLAAMKDFGVCLDMINRNGAVVHSAWYGEWHQMTSNLSASKRLLVELLLNERTRGGRWSDDYLQKFRADLMENARTYPFWIEGTNNIVLTTDAAEYSLSLSRVPDSVVISTETIRGRFVARQQCS